jgi:hypothetical protein
MVENVENPIEKSTEFYCRVCCNSFLRGVYENIKESLCPKCGQNATSVDNKKAYAAYILVKDVLIGQQSDVLGCVISPLSEGVDLSTEYCFTKNFMRENFPDDLNIEYSDSLRAMHAASHPTVLFYFENMYADSAEVAIEDAKRFVANILLSISLTRQSAGKIFMSISWCYRDLRFQTHPEREGYYGNLSTGSMSGEVPELWRSHLLVFEANPTLAWLARLFSDTLAGPANPEYRYVQLWQVLEILASLQQVPNNAKLYDFFGNPILDHTGVHQTINNSQPAKVYALLGCDPHFPYDPKLDLWEAVNIWYALRNCVAHHGGIGNWRKLSKYHVRRFAEKAVKEIEANDSHSLYLIALQEAAERALMKSIRLEYIEAFKIMENNDDPNLGRPVRMTTPPRTVGASRIESFEVSGDVFVKLSNDPVVRW